MTELQIILLVCAVVFVGALYWWGKKNNAQQMQRPFTNGMMDADTPEQEAFEITRISPKPNLAAEVTRSAATLTTEAPKPVFDFSKETTNMSASPTSAHDDINVNDELALASRMSYIETPTDIHAEATHHIPSEPLAATEHNPSQASQSQIFALLVLSPSRELSRKHIHASMEASRLSFHNDGTYVHRDATGNIVFRVANVVEPGFFPSLDDEDFATPGIALVLELPASITPYRAMDEFITVARKVSQNLGGKLYDAQRHLIKESDLKAMREYAQSLTY